MRNVYSVTDVNRYIKNKLTSDTFLSHIFIRGEISNFKRHSSGHLYFTVKDENSSLRCVMFKGQAMNLRFLPEHGMKIIAGGYISVFERAGDYQLYVQDIQPDGIGALHAAYEQLKERLAKEGLFDEEKKKKLPMLPQKICIVTSPTGAAIMDMINVLTRRLPGIELIIISVRVQGENAAAEIVEGIEYADQKIKPDLIITGRGGGSLEDLWAFNEEIVARAIADSNTPIISSVGHETDFTIADFAADCRAPTPSAAAELAVPEYETLVSTINIQKKRLTSGLKKQLEIRNEKLRSLKNRCTSFNLLQTINQYKQRTDLNMKIINERFQNMLKTKKDKVLTHIEKLMLLNPLHVIKRGFSAVKDDKGNFIKNSADTKIDDKIKVIMSDGELLCKVMDKLREGAGIFGREKV